MTRKSAVLVSAATVIALGSGVAAAAKLKGLRKTSGVTLKRG